MRISRGKCASFTFWGANKQPDVGNGPTYYLPFLAGRSAAAAVAKTLWPHSSHKRPQVYVYNRSFHFQADQSE